MIPVQKDFIPSRRRKHITNRTDKRRQGGFLFKPQSDSAVTKAFLEMPAPDDSKGMNGPHPHKNLFLARGIKERSTVPTERYHALPYPPDDKLNSALLLSRRTYPPMDSWNFSPPFGYAGTKSPLTTNQQTSSGWVLPGRSEQQGAPRRRFSSWAAVSRSRGRSAPCPRIWVICSHTMLLQSDLAGKRSQFATENKTASERTFVRVFSTKHGSLRITVGRWLPKETPIRSAPRLGGIYLIPITRRGSL
ncbi:hypothetical protein DCAR_0100246 [Daucus carota subsp. sativus]|uniref:Uncharacterized protein n=1 Tax=Daucus carota subsp. sativus TaxID=79200 RepID=A0AAF0W2U1_DAUCS|nr:hypothetical protein DCAR_0100246 [Daucus carota subsp. sativus]